MKKLSITVPDNIVELVRQKFPGIPLSNAITDVLKIGLGLSENPTQTISLRDFICPTENKIIIPPEIQEVFRLLIREEFSLLSHQDTLSDETTSSPSPDEDTKRTEPEGIIPDQWYHQSQLIPFFPDSIPISTRKSKLSKAISSGLIETNGRKRTECRVKGSSFREWMREVNHSLLSRSE